MILLALDGVLDGVGDLGDGERLALDLAERNGRDHKAGTENFDAALDILADLFPEREVVGIYCGDLIWGFGAIHCMTQQQPQSGL